MIKSGVFIIFSVFLLVYMMLPGPTRIEDFSALPNSFKSTLDGDTVQVPNVSAYFSDNFRPFVTLYYFNEIKNLSSIPFAPIKLNYPPENAYQFIKDQTQSTYLEEYVYPLKYSIFVNGFEPVDENGNPRYWGGDKLFAGGRDNSTKVTIRFYPSSLITRFVVWLGVVTSIFFIYKLSKKIITNG